MSRVKLSEFRAKQLLLQALELDYDGLSIDLSNKSYRKLLNQLPSGKLYVAKVDQAIKKRGKGGLVTLKRTKNQLLADLESFAQKGYRHALVEPYVEHASDEEHYLALQRSDKGIELSYSPKGGVEIESHASSVKRALLPPGEYQANQNSTGLEDKLIFKVHELFQKAHMTLLEVNPLLVNGDRYFPLDAAVEVDSAGQFFAGGAWNEEDVREAMTSITEPEQVVAELNSKSPASLTLKVLNPDGSIFLLLSGGGASVVVADELSKVADYKLVANYGEYSGNPSEDETYFYTQEVLKLLVTSKARKKVLIIAGGVANFTDVAKTFAGIIRAMRLYAKDLKDHKVKVFVRRGGPNQVEGLKAMRGFLEEIGLTHFVYGPDKSLAEVVASAAKAAA